MKRKNKKELENRLIKVEERLDIGEKDIVLKGNDAVLWRAFNNLLIGNGKLYELKDGRYLFTTNFERIIDTELSELDNELLSALNNKRYWKGQ